jgi:hypothetical protein
MLRKFVCVGFHSPPGDGAASLGITMKTPRRGEPIRPAPVTFGRKESREAPGHRGHNQF